MTKRKNKQGLFIGDQRTNIRMSKLARTIQSAAAKTNWNEMAKMLFRVDPNHGRQDEIRKLITSGSKPAITEDAGAAFGADQHQYGLILMLIVSIAEKRTQELYRKTFSQRCDAISKNHDLKDDQYWTAGKAPAEWEDLNAEFEQRSLQILLETLKEYHQDEIAKMVQVDGAEPLYDIIKSIKARFLNPQEGSAPAAQNEVAAISRTPKPTTHSAGD